MPLPIKPALVKVKMPSIHRHDRAPSARRQQTPTRSSNKQCQGCRKKLISKDLAKTNGSQGAGDVRYCEDCYAVMQIEVDHDEDETNDTIRSGVNNGASSDSCRDGNNRDEETPDEEKDRISRTVEVPSSAHNNTIADTTSPTTQLSVNDTFDSFKEFRRALDAYSKENYVQFVIAKAVKLPGTTGMEQLAEKFVYKNVKFMCKHGSHARSADRDRKLRPNQR